MPAMNYERIAHLYDTYVNAEFDIQFFIEETKFIPGEVLELMSGTGRVSIPLLKEKVKLTCLDSSAAMLGVLQDKLKEQNLFAQTVQMNICELSLDKKFDMIIIPFHSFSEIVNPADQLSALEKIHDHLSNSGRFICTLHNPCTRLKVIDGHLRIIGKYPLKNDEGFLLLWNRNRTPVL